jgi:hypothetical protein
MVLAQSQWVRVYAGATNHARWQSYYPGQTIDGYTHLPFTTDGVAVTQTGDQASMSLTLPATPSVVTLVETAIANNYLVDIKIYQFDPDAVFFTNPPSGHTLIASFVGEIIGGSENRTTITLEIGSSLSPVGVQIPPLKYTTALVGEPCRL